MGLSIRYLVSLVSCYGSIACSFRFHGCKNYPLFDFVVTVWSDLLDNYLVKDYGVMMLGPLSATVAQVDGIPVSFLSGARLFGQGMTQFYARISFPLFAPRLTFFGPSVDRGLCFRVLLAYCSGTLSGVAVFRVVAMASIDSFWVVMFLFCFLVMSLGPDHGIWSLVM